MRKRILSLILALVLLSAFPLSVRALEVPDSDRRGSISIAMLYQEEPVPGGTLTLYRVADVVNNGGGFTFRYTADFDGCSIALEKLYSAGLPEELADIARTSKLTGTTLTVDPQGEVLFSDLEIGLYLIVQEEAASGYKKVNPFLVSVPYYDGARYIYDVDTAPKNLPGLEAEPTEPTKPTDPSEPTDPKLPQTGQTKWPIPVMAVVGMLLITAGLCMFISGKKRDHEA